MRAILSHMISKLSTTAGLIGLASTICVALAATTLGYFSVTHAVTLSVDGKTHTVRTFGDDVSDVLAGEGIKLQSRDVVVPSLASGVDDGDTITVRYSRPLEVSVDGVEKTYWTTATKIETALDQLGIKHGQAALSTSRSASIDREGMALAITTPKRFLVKIGGKDARRVKVAAPTVRALLNRLHAKYDANDIVKPALAKRIKAGDKITVIHVRKARKHVAREAVAAGVVEKPDSSQYAGERTTVSAGKPGLRDVTYKVVFHNGKVFRRVVLSQTVLRKPVAAVVRVGTKKVAAGGAWDRIAKCESGGNWHINTGNGYFGGLQFAQTTWNSFDAPNYAARADLASREEQIDIADRVLASEGWNAWPVCSQYAGPAGPPDTSSASHRAHVRRSHRTRHTLQDRPETVARSWEKIYVVERGDSLYSIARTKHVKGGWKALYERNRAVIGANPQNLHVGTRLAY